MIKVVELFAGVGGFRLGLEGYNGKSSSSNYKKPLNSKFEVVWSNQYEPLTPTKQHANFVYHNKWPDSTHSGKNIEDVIENEFNSIPNHDLLVGGFPCQDYSVATTLKNSKGLVGKKGVLWWSIYNIISKKKKKPKYLFLENVDRLLASPADQRGRDFAVMLSCLYEQGYAVEWKVINAADYSMPQRRRRVYIVGYHKSSKLFKKMKSLNKIDIITKKGIISSAFNCKYSTPNIIIEGKISKEINKVSDKFNLNGKLSPFKNSGVMFNGKYYSVKTDSIKSKPKSLGKILEKGKIDKSFYINKDKKVKYQKIKQIDRDAIIIKTEWDKWKYLKGRKSQYKINKSSGYKYKYGEGSMDFPDSTEKPSRTIITGEGGASPSRFKHVIKVKKDVYRRLTPIELEKLNMFPVDHTKHKLIANTKRAFFMGNALVVGVVEKIGKELQKHIKV